jgi:ABC-type antimicrobial peptide transport system permease subunit
MPPINFDPAVLLPSALMAAGLGLVTGALPALAAYRMRIVDALSRK